MVIHVNECPNYWVKQYIFRVIGHVIEIIYCVDIVVSGMSSVLDYCVCLLICSGHWSVAGAIV